MNKTETATALREFKPDLMTTAGSKMLAAFFIAMKIEPSLAGLIKATGNEPELIFNAIGEAAEKAPNVMANVEAVLAMVKATAETQARIEAKLDVLMAAQGVAPDCAAVHRRIAATTVQDAALVTQAALDEASGRS